MAFQFKTYRSSFALRRQPVGLKDQLFLLKILSLPSAVASSSPSPETLTNIIFTHPLHLAPMHSGFSERLACRGATSLCPPCSPARKHGSHGGGSTEHQGPAEIFV